MGWYMDEIPLIAWGIFKVIVLFLIVRGILFLAGVHVSVPYVDDFLQRAFWILTGRLPTLSAP